MASSGNKNPGNFANDREKASEAGKKGGQASGGNVANDRQKALEPVTKVANATKAAAENRNHPNRWGADVLRPGAIRSSPRHKYEIPYIRLSAYTPAQPNLALIGADR